MNGIATYAIWFRCMHCDSLYKECSEECFLCAERNCEHHGEKV